MGRRTAPWPDNPKVLAWRERWEAVDVAVRVLDGYRQHRNNRNAASVAYYGFISVFPLFVVFSTVLGLVLRDNPQLQEDIKDSALASLPFIGQQLQSSPAELTGSFVVATLGLLTALWAGLKAFVAIHEGVDDTCEIPIDDRVNGAVVRVHALVGIVVIGTGLVATSAVSSLIGLGTTTPLGPVLGALSNVALNTAIVGFSYIFLSSRRRSVRQVRWGALFSGLTFTVLQFLATTVVGRAIRNASPVYGTFATVIALLAWMSFHAMAAFFGDELNHALPAARQARQARRSIRITT